MVGNKNIFGYWEDSRNPPAGEALYTGNIFATKFLVAFGVKNWNIKPFDYHLMMEGARSV